MKQAKTLLKIGVSLALILFMLSRVNLAQIGGLLGQANPWGLLAVFLLFGGGVLLRAVRWKLLLDAQGVQAPLGYLTRWYYIGSFFNTILPTGFGGDVVKSMALARYSDQGASAVGTVILDRFLGILVLLGMGALAVPFGGNRMDPRVGWLIWTLFLACITSFWLLRRQTLWRTLQSRLLARLPAGIRERAAAWTWIEPLYAALQGYDRRVLAQAALASLAFNLTWILTNMAGGWALGIQADVAAYFLFVPLVSLALLLPTFGGIGVRELSYVGLFTQVGVSAEAAFALSIVIYASTVATGLVGGLFYLAENSRTGQSSQPEKS